MTNEANQTVKVLTFKNELTGELKYSKWIVQQIAIGVFYYQNPNCNTDTRLILCINDIYFDMGHYSRVAIESQLHKCIEVISDYKSFVFSLPRPNLLDIEVAKLLGLDFEVLFEKRTNYDLQKEVEKKEKEALKTATIEAKKEIQRYETEKAMERLRNGNEITFGELDDIITLMKFPINPRTLGTIRKIAKNKVSKTSGSFPTKMARKTVDNLFNVIADVVSLL